jgi:phosphoribosylformylglycinamidine cyclo-ligase
VGETYAAAGVDIDAGEELVRRIRSSVGDASRPEVLGGIGGFAGLFSLGEGHRDPVLVASTDGVGTKALVAAEAGRLDTIGIDLVAMCVDDLVCTGAEPLFLLDYIAVGKLDPEAVAAVVSGVAEGCRQAGCALLGGETAEHPGALDPDHLDLAGFAVGVVERDRILPTGVAPGDRLIGLPSPGLRSNGYSLARRVLLDLTGLGFDDPAWPDAPRTLGDELLEPSVIYAPAVRALLREVDVRALAHVTGGGLVGNLPRVLPESADAVVDLRAWERPRIFGEISRLGEVEEEEMARVFNLGIGMVAVVPPADEGRALAALADAGVRAVTIGEVAPGAGRVRLTGAW